MGVNEWHRKFARELARKFSLKVIALPHLDQYVAFDENGYADEMPYDVSPADFIKLVKNARYICTDSFHGTMFSLIYGKDFFTFRRFSGKWTLSTNTRIDSIAGKLNIQSRIVSEADTPEAMLSRDYDAQAVQERLQDFRASSLEFLKHSLEA